jgi:hypothetical protein
MGLTNFPNGISSMGVPLTGGLNPFGDTWFVAASGGSDGNKGTDTSRPFATIAKAISKGAVGDNIILGPGTHSVDVSSAALTPLADMQFIAAIPPMGGKPSTIITHDADDGANLVAVDVDGVGFHGIEFLLVAGGTTALTLFDVAQTTAVNGMVFNECWFNLNSVDASGVTALTVDDATNATTGAVFRNCRFVGGDATTNQAVYVDVGVGGVPGCLFEGNVFELESADADCLAFNFADPGAAGKSYALTVRNNDFIGPKDGGGDGIPIVFAAGMTEDEIVPIFRTNFFSGTAATPITQDKINTGIVWNYVGDDATGGTLVDPGT